MEHLGRQLKLTRLVELLQKAIRVRAEADGLEFSRPQPEPGEAEKVIGLKIQPNSVEPSPVLSLVVPFDPGKRVVESVPERLKGRCYEELLVLERDGGLSEAEEKWFQKRKLGKYLAG